MKRMFKVKVHIRIDGYDTFMDYSVLGENADEIREIAEKATAKQVEKDCFHVSVFEGGNMESKVFRAICKEVQNG